MRPSVHVLTLPAPHLLTTEAMDRILSAVEAALLDDGATEIWIEARNRELRVVVGCRWPRARPASEAHSEGETPSERSGGALLPDMPRHSHQRDHE